MTVEEMGCCGAYCGTCPELEKKTCRGCTLGYHDGQRNIARAKCKMKVCCLGKGFFSCADCDEMDSCDILQGFLTGKGYKYRKYRESLAYVRAHGYEKFLAVADGWKAQYGRF